MADPNEKSTPTHVSAEPEIQEGQVHRINLEIFNKNVPEKHDQALDFLRSTGDQEFTYTEREANKVRWKIDFLLMPVLVVTFALNFLDKGQLSNASVYGLREDAHLRGQQYSWVGSIFFFGYLIGQPVAAYLLQKVPTSKWLAGNIFGWAACLLLGILSKNFAGIATSRFFLGLFEATVNPVFVMIVSQYYTRKEHSLRSCIWWAGSPIGSFFGDLIAWGIGHGHGALSPWKYMFIAFGGFSFVWAGVVLWLLPDSPWTMKFMSEREKKIAVLRVKSNHTGISSSYFKPYQALSVLTDVQAWLFFLIGFLQCLPAGGLTAFNKLIITGLGYTNLQANIMSMPEHAIQLVSIIVAGLLGTYVKSFRCATMILSNIPPLVGGFIIYYEPTSHKLTRLAGVYILLTNTVSYIMVMSMISSNFAGMTRKTTVAAGLFLSYSVGNLVAPQLFLAKEAPRYPTGFKGMIVAYIAMIVVEAVLMLWLIWENKRRDRKYGPVVPEEETDQDFLDLTDKEQPHFRYVW